MESKWNIIALLGIMMMVIAAPAAGQPPTSFLIDGWVNDSNGDPVNDPSVTVTSLDTDEVFTVETDASSNYYQAMTCSDNVSANDALNFSVDGGTAFDHAVTQTEMNAGGVEEDLMVGAPVEPDLTVTDLLVNPGNTRDSILRVYVNDSNNISAVVYNAGSTGVTDDFDVCFEADGAKIGCATVTGGLAAGANTTVSIDWTPACANYPVMPGFPAQSLPLTINVTVDCNCSNCPICLDGSCGTITESDETNNTLSKVIPAMQVHSGYDVIGGVVNNGYRSKNFDCDTTEEPLDQFEYYNLIGGGVEYNVSGEKISTFAPQATSTRVHHIDLPSGAIVEDARLYVYWYDKWGNYKTYPTGCLADLSVNFNSTDLTPDTAHQDSKGFGYYQSPKGSTVFNVTSLVSGSGDYTAIVKNAEPIGGNNTTLLGEMLVVVYDGADHDRKVQIWMLEGTDYLMAADDTHNSYNYSVSPVEATATVAFGGSINLGDVESASLITVVAQGQAPGSDMLFNGDVIKTDAWDTPTEAYPNSKIDIEDLSVTDNLTASGNNVGFRDNGTGGMQASNAILVVVEEEVSLMPDLTVTDLLVNPGNTRDSILRAYVNDDNNISAVVYNAGSTGVTDDFDVCFEADGAKIGCATVTGGLAAGANTTVSIDWTPACANYPVMPGFPAQSLPLTINVTVDCNCSNCPICLDGSCGTITESDETNNTLSKVIPAMQVHSGYDVIGGVVNNGYRSKNFDCDTTEEPLDQFEYYNLIGGGVEYNVSGEKISTFAPQATSTRVHHIDLPSGAIVEDARLYVYWYDKWGNYKTYPTGCLADLSVNFNSTDLTPDTAHQDSKGFGYYQSPKGSTVFNVTSLVSGSGDYTAIVKNAEPIGGNSTTLLGEMLVVVYSGADHDRKVQIWMLEGTDYLMAADDTHNSYNYSVSPVEATATVAFGGSINLGDVESASLITVVAQGQAPGSDMLFNGDVIKTDAWDTPTEAYPNSKIDIEDLSVTDNLTASGNNVGFRDNGTGGMQASNAFLVVEYEEEPVASYGDSVYAKKNVRLARRALGEPDQKGAILYRNAKIAIELEETVPACKDVSIWVRKVAVRPASFEVAVSSDGVSWTVIGSETCNSRMWTEYDFSGDFGAVKYIKITKPGTWWMPKIMALDAVYAEN